MTYPNLLFSQKIKLVFLFQFTTSDVKVGLEYNSGRSVEPGSAKSLKLSSGANSQQPIVVMLPWLMGQNKHIAKFASLYLKMGFDVLSCRITPWQLLWPAKGSQVNKFHPQPNQVCNEIYFEDRGQ